MTENLDSKEVSPAVQSAIQDVTGLTVQSAARSESMFGTRAMLLGVLARAGSLIAPWWSPARDVQLREFWKKSDHLSGALYTMTSKMTAIPNKIVARNTAIRAHVEMAAALTDILQAACGIGGSGWVHDYGKWVEDLLASDNGAFREIVGRGDTSGPIIGHPISVVHLDSSRCTRTGNATYPVIYTDIDGRMYKLHASRVMYSSQMPSSQADMFDVGFCAVSRSLNVAQTLIDILQYKQEKLGSRPHREILITKGGLDPSDMRTAFQIAENEMDSMSLQRYSKIVIGGSSTMPEASIEQVPLSQLPDGFDEQTSITLGMATIALAFGVDARELFPSITSGSTRADALLQHLKQRGKGPGQILQDTENLFNYKFLPPFLKFVFDFQDDAEDRQIAEIRQIRANRRVQDLSSQTMDERTLREQMYEDSDITYQQFEEMELRSGRMVDGSPITSLFYKKVGDFSHLLDVGVADPLNIDKNDPNKMLKNIAAKRAEVIDTYVNTQSEREKWAARIALTALDALEMRYKSPEVFVKWDEIPEGSPTAVAYAQDNNYVDPRLRARDQIQLSKRDTNPPAPNLNPSKNDQEE